ncbi:helix-turn-helix domain-containing protein [Mangrovivirga sp. M17]|uniref:Helix-turn-helix domain-containing protein n=1 Tax=Mangrovivirga halotolerans TaxID=2993936 RepID=A0ABT3RLT8_9BACT|nr:helix-turn-helix domain-containing protein [Mangrovivirga halotolerans]MCX2742775.1 helix-turn-helix domain-containing protein [Mangrovivirga halotolerans]
MSILISTLLKKMARKIINNPRKCAITHLMNIIGGRWKIIIIHVIGNKPIKFDGLLVCIPAISKNILTSQLLELEEDGLIEKRVYHDIPPHVDYSLTTKGKSLIPIINSFSEWCEENIEGIEFRPCRIDHLGSNEEGNYNRLFTEE